MPYTTYSMGGCNEKIPRVFEDLPEVASYARSLTFSLMGVSSTRSVQVRDADLGSLIMEFSSGERAGKHHIIKRVEPSPTWFPVCLVDMAVPPQNPQLNLAMPPQHPRLRLQKVSCKLCFMRAMVWFTKRGLIGEPDGL